MAEGGIPSASASALSKDDANPNFLRSMMEMGIHQDDARQALKIVHNRSLEDALAIVFGETPPNFSSVPVISAQGASVEQTTQIYYDSSVTPVDIEANNENMMTYKMIFVVNASLRMSSGKMAAQVAHCAVDLYQDITERRLMGLNFWQRFGQAKIVVRADSTEELNELQRRASEDKSISTAMICDAGRTEIEIGSVTCLGLFGTHNQLQPITGHLKLMNDCLRCTGSAANNPNSQAKSKKNPTNPVKTTSQEATSDTDTNNSNKLA